MIRGGLLYVMGMDMGLLFRIVLGLLNKIGGVGLDKRQRL